MIDRAGILAINCGSSSIKFALFDAESEEPQEVWSGAFERIGLGSSRFVVTGTCGAILIDESREAANHIAALDILLAFAEAHTSRGGLWAVGHRVVHGGDGRDGPLLVTPATEASLQRLVPLAPLHLPHNLAGILAVRLRRPDLPQVACFDTAFHHGLPKVARLTGLPRKIEEDSIRRYGFHGLSYEYVIEEIRRRDGETAAKERIIVAHLGNGASMAAIKGGRSVETTMGFSTLAGLPMGTRSGDIDPGALLYLLIEKKMTPDQLQQLLYEKSGLIGLSGVSRNMADLLGQQDTSGPAEAIDFFCYHAQRHLASLTAPLGGVDRLVFTGGIGANSPEIRARVCAALNYLGLNLDHDRNARNERVISASDSPVLIEAFKTNEELVIARHTHAVLSRASTVSKAGGDDWPSR